MRFVVIQGVVLHTEAVDMIVPHDQQSQVFLRGGQNYTFALTSEEILEHIRHESDEVVRVIHDPAKDSGSSLDNPATEESA